MPSSTTASSEPMRESSESFRTLQPRVLGGGGGEEGGEAEGKGTENEEMVVGEAAGGVGVGVVDEGAGEGGGSLT